MATAAIEKHLKKIIKDEKKAAKYIKEMKGKYKGREYHFYQKVCKKYTVDPIPEKKLSKSSSKQKDKGDKGGGGGSDIDLKLILKSYQKALVDVLGKDKEKLTKAIKQIKPAKGTEYNEKASYKAYCAIVKKKKGKPQSLKEIMAAAQKRAEKAAQEAGGDGGGEKEQKSNEPAKPQKASQDKIVEVYQKRITAIYSTGNRDASNLPAIIDRLKSEKYFSDPHKFYAKICKKFNMEPEAEWDGLAPDNGESNASCLPNACGPAKTAASAPDQGKAGLPQGGTGGVEKNASSLTKDQKATAFMKLAQALRLERAESKKKIVPGGGAAAPATQAAPANTADKLASMMNERSTQRKAKQKPKASRQAEQKTSEGGVEATPLYGYTSRLAAVLKDYDPANLEKELEKLIGVKNLHAHYVKICKEHKIIPEPVIRDQKKKLTGAAARAKTNMAELAKPDPSDKEAMRAYKQKLKERKNMEKNELQEKKKIIAMAKQEGLKKEAPKQKELTPPPAHEEWPTGPSNKIGFGEDAPIGGGKKKKKKSKGGGGGSDKVETYVKRITKIYKKQGQSDKLGPVLSKLRDKYAADPHPFYLKICKKYGLKPEKEL